MACLGFGSKAGAIPPPDVGEVGKWKGTGAKRHFLDFHFSLFQEMLNWLGYSVRCNPVLALMSEGRKK